MKLNLQRNFFDSTKKELLTYGSFSVKGFNYPSGVSALEIENSRLSFIFTPFKGQQIWHLAVDGKEITMQTQVTEPQNTGVYLENYGGFLYHCGIISFGAKDADHPQHGEIPNAEYGSAYIECGEDNGGKYIILGGSLEHNTAFVRRYRFSPAIKLYEDGTVFEINIRIENLRAYPLEYMYLCHINFKPINGAELITSTKYDSEHITVYKTDGSDKLKSYFDALDRDITLMNKLGLDMQCYDPEICFGIKHIPDENKRAYTLQDTNDGACYVSHPTDVLPYAIRWVSRTENEDSVGMCLPATGEHLGYAHAKANGQIKTLAPNATLDFKIEAGWLDREAADKVKEKIKAAVK